MQLYLRDNSDKLLGLLADARASSIAVLRVRHFRPSAEAGDHSLSMSKTFETDQVGQSLGLGEWLLNAPSEGDTREDAVPHKSPLLVLKWLTELTSAG